MEMAQAAGFPLTGSDVRQLADDYAKQRSETILWKERSCKILLVPSFHEAISAAVREKS